MKWQADGVRGKNNSVAFSPAHQRWPRTCDVQASRNVAAKTSIVAACNVAGARQLQHHLLMHCSVSRILVLSRQMDSLSHEMARDGMVELHCERDIATWNADAPIEYLRINQAT